jgi:hypothetical protein
MSRARASGARAKSAGSGRTSPGPPRPAAPRGRARCRPGSRRWCPRGAPASARSSPCAPRSASPRPPGSPSASAGGRIRRRRCRRADARDRTRSAGRSSRRAVDAIRGGRRPWSAATTCMRWTGSRRTRGRRGVRGPADGPAWLSRSARRTTLNALRGSSTRFDARHTIAARSPCADGQRRYASGNSELAPVLRERLPPIHARNRSDGFSTSQ